MKFVAMLNARTVDAPDMGVLPNRSVEVVESSEVAVEPLTSSSGNDAYDSTATLGIIGGLILGALVIVCIAIVCIRSYCHRRRAYVDQRRVLTATTVTATCETQSDPQYQGEQPPPSYLEGPPPQYQQQQTMIRPPFSPGTLGVIEPPPPYTAVPQNRSEVYAPQPSYGAIQRPSTPAV